MKIKIIKDCEVEIAVALDAKGDAIFEPTLFKVGDILDVDVVDFGMSVKGLRKDLPLLQLGDGTCGTFSQETFEVLEGIDEIDDAFAEMNEDEKQNTF